MLLADWIGTSDEGVGAMPNAPRLGELIRESMEDACGTVTDTVGQLGFERSTLSRLLNERAGVVANIAVALESLGWGTAGHGMRM